MTYINKNKVTKTYINYKEDEIILCIPIMDITIDNEYIHYIFNKLNITVEKISQYMNKNNENVKRVILHLKNNQYSKGKIETETQSRNTFEYIKTRLEQNKDVKIVHNYPYYWNLLSLC